MQAAQTVSNHEKRIRGHIHSIQPGQKPGVLLLHGFTSSLLAVSGLVPVLKAHGIDVEMPVLRGHQGKPDDLIGVRAQDWYDDAYDGLRKLCERTDKAVIVGLSMGGLVALQLCARRHSYCDRIAGCVTWAAALGFCNPLSFLVKPLSKLIKTWRGQESFRDPECRKNNQNYPTFPTKAFAELYDFAHETRQMLDDVEVPLCIVHSHRDQVVPYRTAPMLFDNASSPYAELHSLSHSGHELGQDCEANAVFDITLNFIRELFPDYVL